MAVACFLPTATSSNPPAHGYFPIVSHGHLRGDTLYATEESEHGSCGNALGFQGIGVQVKFSETSLTNGTGAQGGAEEGGSETLVQQEPRFCPRLDLGVGTKTPSAAIPCSSRSSYPMIPQRDWKQQGKCQILH